MHSAMVAFGFLVLPDLMIFMGRSVPHTDKRRGAVISFVGRIKRHVSGRDLVVSSKVSRCSGLTDAKVVDERSAFHMPVLSKKEVHEAQALLDGICESGTG